MSKEDPRITEYRNALRSIVLSVQLMQSHDYAGLLRAIDRADTLGPMVEPTLYREKAKAMQQDRALMSAAAAFLRSDGVRELVQRLNRSDANAKEDEEWSKA